MFVIGVINNVEAMALFSFGDAPKTAKGGAPCDFFPRVLILYPAHHIEANVNRQGFKCSSELFSFVSNDVGAAEIKWLWYSWFEDNASCEIIRGFPRIWRLHWEAALACREYSVMARSDRRLSGANVHNVKLSDNRLSAFNEARWPEAWRDRMLDNDISNAQNWPMSRYELIASEINRLTRQAGLDASANRQDDSKGSNNDGSSGGCKFRRPIHWDSFTFYTTLCGLLGFAIIYAGILLYVSREQQ
jgi:hypothetical protein